MKKELTTPEKICLAGVELLGREFLTEAFKLCHPKTQTELESSLAVMQSRWYAHERCKAFRRQIRERISGIATATGNNLKTREGVLNQLISSVKATSGKDSISGIQTLAKMQGYDRPDDEESKHADKRTYFLPWVSACRTCELMRIYQKIQNSK